MTLAYPAGRLRDRSDRVLVVAGCAVIATLYLPTALLVERYPDPSPWSACGDACPANAFMLTGSEPAWVADVVEPLRELLTALLFVAVALRLGRRVRAATPLMRRLLTPVLQAASLRVAIGAAILLLRLLVPGADELERAAWSLGVVASIALALSFLIGAMRWRLFMADCLRRLAVLLRSGTERDGVRAALAEAFDDPGLELSYSPRRPLTAPAPGSGRALTEIRDGGRVIAGVVHDAALRDERVFVEAAGTAVIVSLESRRLATETGVLLDELRASRARVIAGADDERQRIQRDVHDGAQQRLLALRVLELAAEAPVTPETLRGFARDIDAAVEDVRAFAHGVYPPLLSSRGLVAALRSAAREQPLPTRIDGDAISRYPPEIERAAYFCCLEAIQNASKHARGATGVSVKLVEDGELRLEVHDDGDGFDVDTTPPGVGLVSMRDRVATVGGALDLRSCPTSGTSVVVALPTGG